MKISALITLAFSITQTCAGSPWGNITKRLFELRDELLTFLREKEHDFRKYLEDEEFIIRLAYLSDIFEAINYLNLSFQGPNCTVRRVYFKTGGVYPEVRSVEEERGEQEIWNV